MGWRVLSREAWGVAMTMPGFSDARNRSEPSRSEMATVSGAASSNRTLSPDGRIEMSSWGTPYRMSLACQVRAAS